MTSVTLRAVDRVYGAVHVVRSLDLDVVSGEVVALLGASGCGKTTTLRMVAGLERPSGGEIRLGDEVVAGRGRFVPPEARHLGMVFQSYAVWPHMDVAANVAYPLVIARTPRPDREARVRETLRLVGLEALAGRYPHQLSGGQQQRVALARALVATPRVLLLDEPLSNLDARLREEMRQEIATLVRRIGMTVMLVTHDQEEAFAIADRVAVMSQGRIEQVAAPETLFRRPASAFVARFVGSLGELPGRVEAAEADALTVRLDAGPAVRADALPDSPREGAASFAFRPEDARLVDPGEAVVRGTVESRSFLGRAWRHAVRVGDATVVLDDPRPRAAGEPVGVLVERGMALKP